MKQKLCKMCKVEFKPMQRLQSVCSFKCALDFSKLQSAIREKKDWNKRKVELKKHAIGRKGHMTILQREINTLIREIDHGHTCISSGQRGNQQMQAGHYWSVGGHSDLRFNLLNIWVQTATQNQFHSGNPKGYESGIKSLYGEAVWNEIYELKGKYQSAVKNLSNDKLNELTSLVRKFIKDVKLGTEFKIYTIEQRLELRRYYNLKIGIYL